MTRYNPLRIAAGICSFVSAICAALLPVLSFEFFGSRSFNMLQLFDENEDELAVIVLIAALLSLIAGFFFLGKSGGTKAAQIIFNVLSLIAMFVIVYGIVDEECSIGFGTIVSIILLIAAIILSAIPYNGSVNNERMI